MNYPSQIVKLPTEAQKARSRNMRAKAHISPGTTPKIRGSHLATPRRSSQSGDGSGVEIQILPRGASRWRTQVARDV